MHICVLRNQKEGCLLVHCKYVRIILKLLGLAQWHMFSGYSTIARLKWLHFQISNYIVIVNPLSIGYTKGSDWVKGSHWVKGSDWSKTVYRIS